MKKSFSALTMTGLLFISLQAFAGEIHLKDGSVLKGHIGAQGETTIYFVPDADPEHPRWVSIRDVESIKNDPVPAALLKKRKQETGSESSKTAS